MSDPRSINDVTLHWKRPPGPINIWKTIESTKHSKNGKPIKYILQDIPKERYQDALDHMSKFFWHDEPACRSLSKYSLQKSSFIDIYSTTMVIHVSRNQSTCVFGKNVTIDKLRLYVMEMKLVDLSPTTH